MTLFCYPRLLIQDVTASAPKNRSAKRGTARGITFDRFVCACVVMDKLAKLFTALDTDGDGWVKMNYLQFLDAALS